MSLSADNCKIVYYSMFILENEIESLAAKVEEGEEFMVYVQPSSNPELFSAYYASQGEIFTGSEIIRGDMIMPTEPLERALTMFRDFLAALPKPVLLISHSGDALTKELIRAIARTGTTNIFRGVVAGFSDSLVEFRVRFPNRKNIREFTIYALAYDFLEEPRDDHPLPYRLILLERLLMRCDIPRSAFFDHLLPYEIAFDLFEELDEFMLPAN